MSDDDVVEVTKRARPDLRERRRTEKREKGRLIASCRKIAEVGYERAMRRRMHRNDVQCESASLRLRERRHDDDRALHIARFERFFLIQ